MSRSDDADSEAVRPDPDCLDDVVTEAWTRTTDEPDIRGVDAGWLAPHGQWQVGVAVMEFVREGDPPYEDLRRAIESALAGVAGVQRVEREDTEVWLATGSVSGKELIESVARVIDERAEQLRAWYHRPMS